MMQDVFEISIAYDFELLVMMMRCVRVQPGTFEMIYETSRLSRIGRRFID